ncbi:extracellular solute-binding protein [Alloscardovia omnicolens]|uniref:extracellular solute-binding protein n=1 Tax=Alloscardovia omnicolens TaxID=419015 RepID=UPI003A77B9AE
MANYKKLWDLEVQYSPTSSHSMLSSVSYEDSTAEFSRGDVVFYPNGTWSYSTIQGNAIADEDLGILPYYMGIPGEENYAPFSIYDANWAVNKNASPQDQKATLDFIEWMVSSDKGRLALSRNMGLSAPYTTFTDEYQPKNPLISSVKKYHDQGLGSPYSPTVPGIQWHDDFVSALMEYTQGTDSWSRVQRVMTHNWTDEWHNYKSETGVVPQEGRFEE